MGILKGIKDLVGGNNTTAQEIIASSPVQTSKKVLIVEDDVALRELYADILTAEGFVVLTAENGQVGLDMVLSQKPDLVLLDLMMPIMNGKTMLHRVRQIPEFAKLPVIVLTNAGDENNMRETKFFDNANEFLIKSNVTPEDIIQRVKSLI